MCGGEGGVRVSRERDEGKRGKSGMNAGSRQTVP